MIQIKRNNKVFFTLEDFGEGSKLSYQLMDHHYIILKFTTATPIYFEIGDSVEIPDFGYFELTSSYFPKHNNSDGYDYEMQMDAYYMSWKNKICKYRPRHGANETSFNLTTTVGVHMNVILGNLKALGLTYNGKDFSVDYTTYNNKAFDVQKRFLIEYGSISILDALNAICSEDALNCEWWIDGSIIYLGYCEMEGQTTFEQDVNVLSMSYSESKSTYITRLYAFGSDRNIPKGYFTGADADVTTDGVATDYLMLPNKEVDSDGFYSKDGYIENVNVVKNDKQAIEGVVMFEDEYPKVESVVSSIKTYDSTVDNEDGTNTTQTFWQVTSTDSFTNSFKESWIKSNLTLGIKFTSGALMGMEFDVSFKVIDKVNYFEIVANDTYGRTLPDGVMCPKVGDKFFIYNWDATKITDTDLIHTAQLSLFDRAKQYYQKTMISNSNFTCTMDGDKFYNNGTYDYHPLGEQVKLINDMFAQVDADGKHYRNSRIIGMEIPLDIPYDHPQYTVGEKAATSRLGKLEDKVDSITVNGTQIGGIGSGNGSGGVYVIGMNDLTPPTDSNVLSARKSINSFLSKLTDDTANGKITFIKGLIAKALVDLEKGATFGNSAKITELGEAFFRAIRSLDYDNAAEQGFSVEKEKNGKYHAFFTNLTIWGKARFHELEVRKLSYSGGNIYLSGAGSKLIKVVPVRRIVNETYDYEWMECSEKICDGWKCYLLADNGTTATMNYWQEGDQVRCQTMGEIVAGGAYSDVSNKSYWRTIPDFGVSTQNEKIYGTKTETYIDEDGNEQTRNVQVELYDGQAFAWIVIGKHCDGIDGYDDEFSVGYDGLNPAPLETRDIPSAGDTIVLDGNRHRNEHGEYDKTDRQNVIILETTGEYAPRIACYANITEYKHTITKSVNNIDKEVSLSVFETSPKGGTKINSSRFEWISDDGSTINIINYRGDWLSTNTYHKNNQVNHNNAVWVCVANSGVDVTEEPSDGATYWKKVLSGGKGEKGDDGKTPQPTGSAETYYAITSSPSTEPSSWMPTPIDTSKHQGKFLWTDNRTEWKIGDKIEWISNKTCSYIGKDGANGTSVSIKGSLSDIGELPVSGNVNGDSYLIDGYLWIYTGTSVDDDNHHNGFENVGKIKGEDGISATQYYYHVAWMNTSDNSDNSFTTTNPSGSSYAYIGTLIDTTENDSDDYTKYDWAYVKGDRGDDGKNAVRLDLTNESSTVTCDKDGNIIGTIQGTVAILYDGAKEADINMVSYSISSYKGLSSMPTISGGGVISDLSVSEGKTSLEASINIKAAYKNQDYYATYTITKVLAGSDGTPATTYWIEPSATAIKVDSDGNANPSTITCKQYKQVGAESPVSGDKNIYYRNSAMDSILWNEYTEAIIPAVNVEAYEFVLSDRIPSNIHAIIYDRESIPVVKDGQNGNDGLSGNSIVPAYVRSKDTPTPPTSTDKNNLDNGWSLTIPSVADVKNVRYSDSSWTDYNDGSYTWKKSPTTANNSISWCLVTFTTTQANQAVKFVIKSFSEPRYDYIFLSEIDADSIPSTPGYAGASRAVSGNGVELSITDVVATAGTHTVYICYGKDASGDYNGDYGLFRIEKMTDIPLWQSNGKEVFTREDSGAINSEIISWSEPFKVTGENGTDGKDAYRVVVSPSVLIFDTDDNGRVTSLSDKTATIRVYQGDKDVSNQFSKYDSLPSNKYNCNGSLKDLGTYPLEIQVTAIETQVVTDAAKNESEISKTNGFLEFILTNGSANVTAHVDVQVNVSMFTGQMVNTNKQFSKTLQEVSNRVDDKVGSSELTQFKAEIAQTAREISLSVSEKSIGRRNLLVGSAFLREDNNRIISNDARIEMNSGYQGTNCIHVIDATEAGNPHYVGVYWDGSQGGRSVKIEKGKKYTMSCFYKTNDINAKFYLEAIYTDKQENATRIGQAKYLSPNEHTVKKVNEWELFTTVVDTTDAEYDYIAFNFWEACNVAAGQIEAWICRPMVEEGDTYNGWTLSQDDYDYVGGNMLDNTLSLDKSGTLYDVNGTLTPAGFGESTSIYKSFVYKLKGTVDSFSQLPSSGNVYNDTYFVRNDWTCYAYNGSEFVDVGNDYYYEVLSWRKSDEEPFGLEANKDYVFSFMAKGTGRLTAYFYYPDTDVFVEDSLGGSNIVVNGQANFQLTNKWERYWVHWRPSDSLHRYIILRLSRTIQSSAGDAPITDCYIAQPKLEEGARVTEYTERKSDLVDKASLKAAGIEITSDMVELYGNQVKVSGAKGGTPVAMFENGMLNSNLINADKIMARQLQTTGSNGQSVSIENGLMEVYGTMVGVISNLVSIVKAKLFSLISTRTENGCMTWVLISLMEDN